MKLSFAFIAAAAATGAPPVISLNFDAKSDFAKIMKLKNSVVRSHDLGYKNKGKQVGSRQDWVERCPAGTSTAQSCPFPKASAFDHNDGKVSVTKRIFLVDQNGKSMLKQVQDVNFNQRATYLFKFDATDSASNHAEQIVFGLILDDVEAPKIKVCGKNREVVEAATKYAMCSTSSAKDNIDKRVSVHYSTKNPGGKVSKGKFINTKITGTWTVTMKASDAAGVYGHNGANNKVSAQKLIVVKDTIGPKISLTGSNVVRQECRSAFTDKWGATAKDALDGSVKVTSKNNVKVNTLGTYKITYASNDKVGNKAATVTRSVDVKDSKKPSMKIYKKNGKRAASTVEIAAGKQLPWYTSKCVDTCSKYTKVTTKVTPKFNTLKPGTYTRTYTCKDVSGNAVVDTTKFEVVDKTRPVLNFNGLQTDVQEAKHRADYFDQGATCSDNVDGQINDAVRVSGDIVKMSKPGTYKLVYTCKDSKGLAAKPLTRKVVVKDTTCPVITLKGKSLLEVEAGFPYKDAGAKAHDSLDGDLTKKITVSGDTVTVAQAFYAKKSCAAIKKAYPGKAPQGTYFITTKIGGKYNRVKVSCDMNRGLTFKACKNCKRVTPYGKNAGDCGKYGMKMLQRGQLKAAKELYPGLYFPARGASNMYVCAGVTTKANVAAHSEKVDHRQITQAESGKYVIKYSVKDSAGNKHCKIGIRTVIVKDTLPPVITVTIGNKLIHTSKGNQVGLNGKRNPAGNKKYNPFFMAESQTVNGWIIGAIASATAGVALLGMSNRRTTTSVPV